MTARATWNSTNWIFSGFACELVAIQRYNEEIPDVVTDGFSVCSPKWGDAIQQECKGIHTKFPKLLVLILVALLQSDDVRELIGVIRNMLHKRREDGRTSGYTTDVCDKALL
jgi:hypothetical protein